jgi:hypothetical protein
MMARRPVRVEYVVPEAQAQRVTYADQVQAGIVPASLRGPNFVAMEPKPQPTEFASMAGAVPMAALTASPGVHLVEFKASYLDRADGFVRSTLPLWWAVSGASAGIVLAIWTFGPLTGRWGFLLGWWATSELLVIALTSIGVWAAMWRKWHKDGPDAIASRAADSRLRMAEKWFSKELDRVYGGDN